MKSRAFLFLLLGFLFLSCGENQPTLPSTTKEPPNVRSSNSTHSRYLLSYSMIEIQPSGSANVHPVRHALMHLNVLSFLEQGPCTNCVAVKKVANSDHGTRLITIEIRHPFQSKNLTGFDVRGIAIFNASATFPAANLNASDRSLGDAELINPDGFTTLYNPQTAGQGPGGLQGYLKGKFSSAQEPNGTLNGYRRFVSSDPYNTRNAFYAGTAVSQTYDIAPPDGQLIFGYAVDASWTSPIKKPVNNPMTDFPPEANCPEPWKLVVTEQAIGNGLTEFGGSVKLLINVYDYQGYLSHKAPKVECPALFDGTLTASWVEPSTGYSKWQVIINNEKLPPAGVYDCLVSVEDNENANSPKWLDLTSYHIEPVEVKGTGWAKTWGGPASECAYAAAIDHEDKIIVTGWFQSKVDLDPGPPKVEVMSKGGQDVFLSKFNKQGNFIWGKAWGGLFEDQGLSLAIDASNNIYIAGSFESTVDFDPGDSSSDATSKGALDAFVSKFTPNGDFLWVKTWGGSQNDIAWGVGCDASGSVYVTGQYQATVDFDPGNETDFHTAIGDYDIFLNVLDSEGKFKFARTFGGSQPDIGYAVAVQPSGAFCLTGEFRSTVDFDPGSGTSVQTSKGLSDAFISKFDSEGGFLGCRTWGGVSGDNGMGAAIDAFGNIYIAGGFRDIVDFNPGPGLDQHEAKGYYDAYLAKYDSSLNFKWAKTWGGSGTDTAYSMTLDSSSNAYVVGWFWDSVDFNPDPLKQDVQKSIGHGDAFLSKFNSNGEYQWAVTWGSTSSDSAHGICVDSFMYSYAAGDFTLSVDFDPTNGIHERVSNGQSDAYLVRYLPNGSW